MLNLMKKELKVGFSTVGIIVVLIPLCECVATLFMSKSSLDLVQDVQLLKGIITNMMMYFPAMQIPMIETLLMQSVLGEERRNRIISVLLANGVAPQKIWRSKVLMAMGTAYILNLFSIIIGILYVKVVYGIWINMNLQVSTYLFLLVPMISFAFGSIICLLIWISRRGQFFIGFIPALSYFACMYMSLLHININARMNEVLFSLGIIFLSVTVIMVCDLVAGSVKKEYLVSMES